MTTMPPLSSKHKKLLSAFGVVVAGSLLTLLNAYVVRLPAELQGFIGSVLAGAMLLVKAWGVAEEQEAKVEAKSTEKAIAMVNEIVAKEAP